MQLSLCAFASAASMRICDPLLPVLAREFETTLTAASAATTGFAIAYGGSQLFLGPMGDRFGRLRVIVVTIMLAALACLLSAFSTSLGGLVFARVLTGIFAAAVIPLSMAWIGDHVPFAERQPVLARYLIGQMLGMTTGQIAGGVFADWLDWRHVFLILALLFSLGALLLWRAMPAADRYPGQPAAAPGFVRTSRHLLGPGWPRVILATVALEGMLIFGAATLIASYLQRDLGIPTARAGTITALFGLGGILYAVNARRLIGRLSTSGVATGGGLVFATAMALLVLAGGWQLAVAATLLSGLGYYMLHNTLQTQATQMAPEARGAALAWFASLLWLGQGVGIAAGAAIAERAGFPVVFIGAGIGLVLLALRFGWLLRRPACRV